LMNLLIFLWSVGATKYAYLSVQFFPPCRFFRPVQISSNALLDMYFIYIGYHLKTSRSCKKTALWFQLHKKPCLCSSGTNIT
jgi:hypothetical protein